MKKMESCLLFRILYFLIFVTLTSVSLLSHELDLDLVRVIYLLMNFYFLIMIFMIYSGQDRNGGCRKLEEHECGLINDYSLF